MLNRFTKFISDIVRKDKDESAKRIVALVVSVAIVVLLAIYTSEKNIVSITLETFGFISLLLGVAAWEDVEKLKADRLKSDNKDKDKTKDEIS